MGVSTCIKGSKGDHCSKPDRTGDNRAGEKRRKGQRGEEYLWLSGCD